MVGARAKITKSLANAYVISFSMQVIALDADYGKARRQSAVDTAASFDVIVCCI